MITVESLTKRFRSSGVPAVDSMDLEISEGEIVGFAGLNGAGKTTAMKVMAGILLPTSGKVTIDGHDIVQDKINASKELGWVPETPVFDDDAKPIRLLKYYAGFHGISSSDAEKRGRELLESVSLTPYINRRVNQYSQGMKKRFALASAMLADPKNYLFDETLNGLDPQGVQFIRDKITELKNDGKTVFISSHLLKELQDLADRVAIINTGKIIDTVKVEELGKLIGDRAEFVIENLDNDAKAILEKYGKLELRGKTAILTQLTKKAAEINAELVKSDYIVTSFRSDTLENYFLKKVRGDK